MKKFEEVIIDKWADRFQCPPSKLRHSGTTLLTEERYLNENRIILWHIGKHTFAIFDPACMDMLKEVLARLPADFSLSGDHIRQALGTSSIASHDTGLIHYRSPSDRLNLAVSHPFQVRALAPTDQAQLSSLHSSCTPEEVDDGYIEIDHEIVFGCFHGDKLVSAASGYRMAGFMDIGVLTHPSFRKQGLGRMVVSALCEWATAHDIIAQYRCNSTNIGSLGLASSLHFHHYFSSESLEINHGTGK